MSDKTPTVQTELRKEVQVDGVRLGVIARKIEEDEWELCIENAIGARSVWVETFPTASKALNAGVEAIESEGIESFAD
jgi:hypothetical protein